MDDSTNVPDENDALGINWDSYKKLVKNNVIKTRKINRYEEPYLFGLTDEYKMNPHYLIFGHDYVRFKEILDGLDEENCTGQLEISRNSYSATFETHKRRTYETLEDVFSKIHMIDGKENPKLLNRKYEWEELFFLSNLSNNDDLKNLYKMIYDSVRKSTISSIRKYVKNNKYSKSLTSDEAMWFQISPTPTISRIIMREHLHEMDDESLKNILVKRENILKNVRIHETSESPLSYVTSIVKQFPKKYSASLSLYGLDEHEILKRMQFTNAVLTDPLINKMNNNKGMFTEWNNYLYVRISTDAQELSEIAIHEIVHQLSGQAIIERSFSVDNEKLYDYFVPRLGVRFSDFKNYIQKPQKVFYHWLNEAITEDISQGISPSKFIAYQKERELYSLLLTSGKKQLSKELFARAYFEDFNPDAHEKIPYWKEMWTSVQKSYDNTFLQRLDAHVKKNGLQSAISAMKTDIRRV